MNHSSPVFHYPPTIDNQSSNPSSSQITLDFTNYVIVINPIGHPGPLEPCIDFYINGAVVGYVDANGWNNA